MNFLKSFWQSLLKFNGLHKALKTQKIVKIKKKLLDFLKSLGQFLLKFNDIEAISKQLTALIKR